MNENQDRDIELVKQCNLEWMISDRNRLKIELAAVKVENERLLGELSKQECARDRIAELERDLRTFVEVAGQIEESRDLRKRLTEKYGFGE